MSKNTHGNKVPIAVKIKAMKKVGLKRQQYTGQYTKNWIKENAGSIKFWFNPDTFDWERSFYLARYCFKDFNVWRYADKFDWENSSILPMFCSEHFKIWWDADRYSWDYSHVLVENCSEYFDLWFDPEVFNWGASYALATHCNDKFELWFDADRYDWGDAGILLMHYCWAYRDIWCHGVRGKYYLFKHLNGLFGMLRGDHGCLPVFKVNNGN